MILARPTLITTAPFGSCANCVAPIIECVSGVSGAQITSTWHCAEELVELRPCRRRARRGRSCRRPAGGAARSRACRMPRRASRSRSRSCRRRSARACVPSAATAGASPMNSFCAQRACCWFSMTNGICFASASVTAITCSAIGTACTPRVLLTAMPRANNSGRHKRLDRDRGGVNPAQLRRLRELVVLQDPRVGGVAERQAGGALLGRGRVNELNVGKSLAERLDALGRNLPLRHRLLDRDENVHGSAFSFGFGLAVVARPSTFLLHQLDVADHHRLVDGLHHVVQRQRRHRDGGQRFHFDAGLARDPDARFDRVTGPGRRQIDRDVRQGRADDRAGSARWSSSRP